MMFESMLRAQKLKLNPQLMYWGFDDDMNSNSHINYICKKSGKQVNALQCHTGVLYQKSRMAIYQRFVMANFDHCPLAWSSRSIISKLEKFEEGALRFVLEDSVSSVEY